MQVEKLRSLIRESINEYIKTIDEAGTRAMYEAKMKACDDAMDARKKKIEMAESLEEMQGMFDENKINDLRKEMKLLEKQKAKYGKMLDKMNKGKEVVTEEPTEEAPVDEAAVTAEMGMSEEPTEEALNESFLKMQKLAGVITETQYNQKRRLVENYTPPAYEVINDLMDYINMNTGTKGRIVPYRSISWLPSVSDADGNMDMLVYTHPTNTFITEEGKKEKQEIAIGADDVYQSTDDPDSNVWIIQSNDPNVDFGEHMTFDEAENAASEWLKS